MKRVLSLILALVMILGTMPMAFAADQSAGEMLQAAGFVAGDENGNLMEDNGITRAELAVLVAELNGVKENAKTYAIAPEFKDVNANDWFGPYVAYAAKEGWFKGDDAGNFNPAAKVSDQVMATVMLRALGYEPAWETAVSEAKAMGLPVAAADAAGMTRGEAFSTMWAVVNTPKQGSDVALGVELGKIEPAKEEVTELVGTIDFAKSVANTFVNVDFDGNVDAAAAAVAANYTIVEKADTTKTIAVLSVEVEDGDDVLLETEALTAGKAYTVMAGGTSANFAGVAKDTDAPAVDSVKGTDTGIVEIVFEDAYLDRASAEDVANYSIDTEGTVVKAEMDSDRYTVTLTVEGFTTTKAKKLTAENVASLDGVVMKKTTKSFGPKNDTTAPKIQDVVSSDHNNVEVIVQFDDAHGVDQATAEDVSNYEIAGLDIISAKAGYINSTSAGQDDYYDQVILTTSEQQKSKRYTLDVKYMVDGSAAANATTKVLDEKFTGGKVDDDAPKLISADHRNLSEIKVVIEEGNSLDLSTALDTSNYYFKDEELTVLSVEFDDEDHNGNTYEIGETGNSTMGKDDDQIILYLTVSEMEEDETYKLYVNNLADNFGNVMDEADDDNVRISDEILTYSQVVDVKTTDLEEVILTFDEPVREASAEDATNYVIDGGIGAVKSASLGSDDLTVTLTVAKLVENKTYTVTANNVENFWGYTTEDSVMKFIAINDTIDTDRPEVDDVDYDFHGELSVTFNEPVKVTLDGGNHTLDGSETHIVATYNNLDYVLVAEELINDDTTVVFNAYEAIKAETFQGKNFKIKSILHVTDESMNTLDYTSNDEDFTTANDFFASATSTPGATSDERVTIDSVSQEDGNTIHIVFDRAVKLVAGDNMTVNVKDEDGNAAGTMDFDLEIDDDDETLVIATKTSGDFPKDEIELQVKAHLDVTDLLGRAANDKLSTADVDNDDDGEPTLEEVEIVDNKTIILRFDEKLASKGSYAIQDTDEDEAVSIASYDWVDSDEANAVEVTLSGKLTTNNYELTIKTSPRDLAGNKVEDEDETFSFVGVDNSPAIELVLAKVVNSTEVLLVNGVEDFSATPTFVIKKNDVVVNAANYTVGTPDGDEVTITFDQEHALLSKLADNTAVTYTFTVVGEDYTTQDFTGLLEEEEANATTGSATSFILDTGVSYDDDSYNYVLVNVASGAEFVLNAPSATTGYAIAEGDAGTLVITTAADLTGVTLKLVVYPVDNSVKQGAIDIITETFSW